jgi:integrase
MFYFSYSWSILMAFQINITKRERTRKLRSGATTINVRWVVNYKDPRTNKRVQLFFERQKDAAAKRNEIIAQVDQRSYVPARDQITIADAVQRWLDDRNGEVKERTRRGYQHVSHYIVGPLLLGTSDQRRKYTEKRVLPKGTELIPMLGSIKVNELTTSQIRQWHKTLSTEVGNFTANRARLYLAAALALVAEDLGIRPPVMPSKVGRGRHKAKKVILTTEQVAQVLRTCRTDSERGLYVAFPFLTGTRPSEQLALLWDDVDFGKGVIRVRRMQEMDGTICEFTKTTAGRRDIPLSAGLQEMLLAWRDRCPSKDGEPQRVFPGLGQRQIWPLPRVRGGGTLLYSNYRSRIWAPLLKRAGVPYVTPHSARHSFISTMQAQGIEISLVAKIAGHANAAVTLGHYTQAVRGGEAALTALELAYQV